MKKALSSLLTLLTLFTGTNLALANFPDVPSTHPNYDAINYVQTEGIVSGNPDGTYQPDKAIDRAAFTKIMVESKYTQKEIDACTTSTFPDVTVGTWYTPYVCVAQKNGILSGYPDGTFKPALEIKVVEAAKIIVNAFGYPTQTDPIWYKPYILSLESYAALPTSFAGFEHKVDRGEMAEMIARLLQKDTTKPSTTYTNLEKGIMVEEEAPQPTATIQLNQVGQCDAVKTVDFVVDEKNLVQYGSFTWKGTVVSSTENDETHLRFKVASNGSVAFEHYKARALMMNNEGPDRYLDGMLYFQLGSLEGQSLFTFAQDINETTKAAILANKDSGKEITLNFAAKFAESGGAGLYGMTSACYIGQ